MADFDTALKLVLRHEGNFSNAVGDPGGPTMRGITQSVYSAYLGRPATVDDVQNMPVSDALAIYRRLYWEPIKGDSINDQNLANWLMDMAVLRGQIAAAKTMQTALGLKADGVVGNVTLGAMNKADAPTLLQLFYKGCMAAFLAIVKSRAASLPFLPGWSVRALEMLV